MSKKPTANALAQQVPTDHLLYIIEAFEHEIKRVRASRDISQESKAEILPPLIDTWQMYKTALEHEETILLLCSIR